MVTGRHEWEARNAKEPEMGFLPEATLAAQPRCNCFGHLAIQR